MQLKVLWLGRPTADPFRAEVDTYQRRVRRRWPCEDVPLKPHRRGREDDPRRALAQEAEVVLRAIPADWFTVVLDEGGRGRSSEAFAALLAEREGLGCPGVAFVIGSDLGLDPEVIRRGDLRLSLSAMTLPHLLARLVLWEQLFRAVHILGGGGYHRQALQ